MKETLSNSTNFDKPSSPNKYERKPDDPFWETFTEDSISQIRDDIRRIPELETLYITTKEKIKGDLNLSSETIHRAWVLDKLLKTLREDKNMMKGFSPKTALSAIMNRHRTHQF